jgi:hypothetical protein
MRPPFIFRNMRRPSGSLLMSSAAARVSGALVLAAVLWLGVVWALH